MGLTPREAARMSLREFFQWRRGHQRQERAEWRRQLAVVNTIIGVVDGDPVTLEDLEDSGGARRSDEEEYQALLGRHKDWIP
jgi:hypothetical protein